MLYFVVLTHACNLRCDYCGYGQEHNEPKSSEVSYTVQDLKNFLSQDPEPDIIFYGGEPLLRLPLMEKIMDSIPAKRYLLQTNTLLLRDVKPKYLKKFNAILVSIDGRKETTNYHRGKEVYDRILENLTLIRQRGFRGDLIARMTVSEKTDIFTDVMHLVKLQDPKFDHVHWQLDVLWDSPPESRLKNFERWLTDSYDPGIAKLVAAWGDGILKQGRVLPIVPFTGIMWTLLTGEQPSLRCGAGIDSFSITTSGDVTVCPIAPEWEFAKVGTIFQSNPQDLPNKVQIGAPCTKCKSLDICGGRCLFTNKTKLWGEAGFWRICNSTKTMIKELTGLKPEIAEMILRRKLTKEEFHYPKFNNGLEVTP
nr:TIGR04084 family radical SAM/SPASM domain-containing protein [Candidatus Njordarchaeota archaeon]